MRKQEGTQVNKQILSENSSKDISSLVDFLKGEADNGKTNRKEKMNSIIEITKKKSQEFNDSLYHTKVALNEVKSKLNLEDKKDAIINTILLKNEKSEKINKQATQELNKIKDVFDFIIRLDRILESRKNHSI